MADTAIALRGVGKRYRLGVRRGRYGRLTEAVTDRAAALTHRVSLVDRPREAEVLWALSDVDLRIGQGEVVGIVGRNGAGKSTLLKLLSRITPPTTGVIEIEGRIGALLEVGTGFHPELTGRENVFLSGSILGMRRSDIRARFDDIVDFAEVAGFLDTPVKRYSSGMYLRLAFSVAIHLQPEIVVVDELLAVGDASFQQRCLDRMAELGSAGRTVLVVSHNMAMVQSLCSRAVLLEQGRVVGDGDPPSVVSTYLKRGAETGAAEWRRADTPVGSRSVAFRGAWVATAADGPPMAAVDPDQPGAVVIEADVNGMAEGTVLLVRLTDSSGTDVFTSWSTDSPASDRPPAPPGCYRFSCALPPGLLRPGTYWVTIGAHFPGVEELEFHPHAFAFEVTSTGYRKNLDRVGAVSPTLVWTVAHSSGMANPAGSR